MNSYTVHENQTLLDVSAHVYGRADVAVDLAFLNAVSITETLQAGQVIMLVDSPADLLVKRAIESRNIIPATQLTESTQLQSNYLFPQGEFAILF